MIDANVRKILISDTNFVWQSGKCVYILLRHIEFSVKNLAAKEGVSENGNEGHFMDTELRSPV